MSREAEVKVIGSLLINNEAIGSVYNTLTPNMFSNDLLSRMYLEFVRGYDNNYSVNPLVLEQKIRCDEFPSDVINDVIRECIINTTSSLEISSYADVIINDYKAYSLDKFLSTIKVSPNNVDSQIRALYEELEVFLGKVTKKSKTLSEIASENKDKYFKDNQVERIDLGFEKLDTIIGGLEGGDMVVLGARPSVGKSALVTQITSNLSKRGKRIGFYNLEMQEKQVYERFVVSESGIPLTRLRRAISFLGDEKERFDKANEVIEKADNIVLSTGSKSISEIRSECRHMDFDVIIIDYLQLVKADTTYRGNRYAEVGAISKAVKGLAMELNIPIIALSQLNRVSEGKDTKEPTMSELREAGDIEQDASVIILLWNLSQEDRSKKGCKVDKNRQGSSGKVVFEFEGEYMRFSETNETVQEASKWENPKDDCPF